MLMVGCFRLFTEKRKMKNSNRISSRVIGLILGFVSVLFEQYILAAIFFGLILIAPLIFLPISLLLQKFGKKFATIIRPPFLRLLYYFIFVPYGLLIQLFISRPAFKIESSKLSEIDFDSQS